MGKFKTWLYGRFLPAWCREDCLDELERKNAVIRDLKAENEDLRTYIDGMRDALRLARPRHIVIGGEGEEKS